MKCANCSSLIIINRGRNTYVPGAPINCPHCQCTMRLDRRGQITLIQTRPTTLPPLSNIPKETLTKIENDTKITPSLPATPEIKDESKYFSLPATYKFAAAQKLGKNDTQFIREQYMQERNAEINRLTAEMKAQAENNPLFKTGPIKEQRLANINTDALLRARDAEISQLKQGVQPVNPQSFLIQETRTSGISEQEIQRMDMARRQQNEQFLNQQKRGTDAVKLNSNLSYYDPNASQYYQFNH